MVHYNRKRSCPFPLSDAQAFCFLLSRYARNQLPVRWGQSQMSARWRVIGIPIGDPVGCITQRIRCNAKVHGHGTCRKKLLPFRNAFMCNRRRNNTNDQWSACKTCPLLVFTAIVQRAFTLFGPLGEILTNLVTNISAIKNEAPWCKASVIWYARSHFQQFVEFSPSGAGSEMTEIGVELRCARKSNTGCVTRIPYR